MRSSCCPSPLYWRILRLTGRATAAGGDEFSFRPQTSIAGPAAGPAFIVEHVTNVEFHNLEIMGHNTGVIVTDSAVVRFTSCSIHANNQGTGADNVNLTAAGCDGCNVVLGSNNTALVIENSFWVWAEDCSFYFYPLWVEVEAAVTSEEPSLTTPTGERPPTDP